MLNYIKVLKESNLLSSLIHGVISKTVFNHGGRRFDSCLNSSADGNKGRSLSLSSPGNRIMNAFYLQPYFIKF